MKRIGQLLFFALLVSCSKNTRNEIEPVAKLENEKLVMQNAKLLYIVDGVETPLQSIYPALKDVITKTQVTPLRYNKMLLAKYKEKNVIGIVNLTTNRL